MDNNNKREIWEGSSLGRYQIQQYVLHLLPAFTAGVHMLSQTTVGATPDHKCSVPEEWYQENVTIGECSVQMKNGTEEPCSEWIYDTTYYGNTIVTDWSLVCGQRWMRALSQSILMFGVLCGAMILGPLADKYGRLKILYFSCVMQAIFGVLAAFCHHYIPFFIIKWVLGVFGGAGAYMTGFVLTMEMVGRKHRTAMGFGFQALFAFGAVAVAIWGYFIRNWKTLQLVYGLHSIILLGHWWLVDESVGWLYSQGRKDEAKAILEKSLKVNKMEAEVKEGEMETLFTAPKETQSYGLLDLLKTPRMRLRTINMCFNWFSNSLVYYGLLLNTDTLLSGNPYLMLALVASADLPSYIFSPYLVDRFGRRSITSIFMLIGGGACIMAAFTPKDTATGSAIVISLVVLGKLLIAGSFAIIYNYTAEMYPTVVRTSAIGGGAMCARLSSTLTPWISLLDSFDPKLPSVIFGSVALLSGFLTLFLPETLNKPMPQTMEEGEEYGRGDTAFSLGKNRSKSTIPTEDP
ncbi:organic cation transporter protein-like isoform X3 [Artemia franciscana]|uniref:Major facilitator superfamily (MFS) profile domain-containing protein n=1 Tax=Artemia franciscana TaxID=6661 RepID=A0AA88HZX5_ARTSF|nr:hypothetical protein QYM36_010184 [Artemia franciscana]